MKSDIIQQIVNEHEYMWTSKKQEYALVRMEERFQVYHIPTQGVGDTEIEEANEQIWANMIEAGVTVLEKYPSFIKGYLLAFLFNLQKRFGAL